MSCGCPALVSNVSSIPEVCGVGAEYFNPYNVNDIVINLEKILTDENLRKSMIERGMQRKNAFSWELSASKIHELILSTN